MLLRALHAAPPAACSALIAIGVRPELTLAVTSARGAVKLAGTVTPSRGGVMLEIRAAGGAQRVVERTLTEVKGGAFAATVRLGPGRYWVSAHTQADAANLPGESPPVAADI